MSQNPDQPQNPAPPSIDSKEDIYEALKDDSGDSEEKLELPKEDDDEEEEGEREDKGEIDLKEDDEEKEEAEEEDLELVTPVRRQEILKKYPQIFKDFPHLEKAYYREQKFTELLPTIQDAEEAVAKSRILDKFEGQLLQGETEEVLSALRRTDEKAFHKVVDNYLITLGKVDQGAYFHVVGNVIKNTIVSLWNEGNRGQGNDVLKDTARTLQQFVFGASEFTPPTKLSKETEETESQVNEIRTEFLKERFETARDDLNSRVTNTIKSTIADNIDPKGQMTDYVKKNAVREAIEATHDLIREDARFVAHLERLWESSLGEKFSKSSQEKIKKAYLSKAKTVLPQVIQKSRNEALKGLGKSREETDRKGPLPVGRISGPSSRDNKKMEIPKGMKTLDFLMRD